MQKYRFYIAAAAMFATMPAYAEDTPEGGFGRMVLLEEFTTEQCSSCPAGSQKLHNILARPEFAGRLAAICHHVAVGTDLVTLPSDKEYLWFFNNPDGSTFAPGLMIDRKPVFSETSPVVGMINLPEEEMCAEIAKRLAEPSPIAVSVGSSVGDDDIVTVNVSLQKGDEDQERAMITVFLVENNVASYKQMGAEEGYLHQHVARACNKTWGERIEWDGNEYSCQYVFDLDETWKREDMEVVAFVNRDYPNDLLKCEVINAAAVSLLSSGIDGASAERRTAVAHYDMQGRRLRGIPSKGICVTLYSDGTCEKSVSKPTE